MAEVKECKNDESQPITTEEECDIKKCIFVGDKCYLPPGKLTNNNFQIHFKGFWV